MDKKLVRAAQQAINAFDAWWKNDNAKTIDNLVLRMNLLRVVIKKKT